MNEHEYILSGKRPRRVETIEMPDGNVDYELFPWFLPPKVIGKEIHRAETIFKPY